ncbi:deubiquitinase OTUD6B isoform 3-T3 [Spinachia spinachia]
MKIADGDEQEEGKQPRLTKAQKRRDKKAAEEKERESRIAEAEVQNLQGVRHQEGLKLAQKLAQRQLQIKEISSDGHCMYRAIEDQLAKRSEPGSITSVKELRSRTAERMRGHADDFLPFLTNPNTGDMFSTDEFEKYCSDVEHTAAWGGQLELHASCIRTRRALQFCGGAEGGAECRGELRDCLVVLRAPDYNPIQRDSAKLNTRWVNRGYCPFPRQNGMCPFRIQKMSERCGKPYYCANEIAQSLRDFDTPWS